MDENTLMTTASCLPTNVNFQIDGEQMIHVNVTDNQSVQPEESLYHVLMGMHDFENNQTALEYNVSQIIRVKNLINVIFFLVET